MKKIINILLLLLLLWFYLINIVNASIDLKEIDHITNNSLGLNSSGDVIVDISDVWISILTSIKNIIFWLLIIFLVYVGIQMIISMWSDEEELSTAKRQLRYTVVAMLFINIPWSIYDMFSPKGIDISGSTTTWTNPDSSQNIFFNWGDFQTTFNDGIILFLEALILGIAIFVIVLSWIKIILSRWKEEDVSESKNKIIWSIVWLIFVGFIRVWKNFVYNWRIGDWANIFFTIERLVLFFAWPVAIIFLTMAWWYYITSNGEEDRTKKAKSIIINTLIATVILLMARLFFKDLLEL